MIDGTLWDVPERYISDSPIFGLPRVTTPLLLLHGKIDDVVPFTQSVEMFEGLARLGKVVRLVGYDDRDHITTPTHPDYRVRFIRWINRYLKATN